MGTSETSAIGSLRSMSTAQEQFKQQVIVDQDGDRVGEYGWLGELAGNQPVRGTGQQMNTSPFIAAILGVRDAKGIARKSGYLFGLYLRDQYGVWRREPVVAGAVLPGVAADADAQESEWICYAWPQAIGQSGNRVFMVNQAGDVYASSNAGGRQKYTGTTRVPKPDAALADDGSGAIGLKAGGLTANDGGVWVPAGN